MFLYFLVRQHPVLKLASLWHRPTTTIKKEHGLLLIYLELGARVELLKDAQFCHAGSSKKMKKTDLKNKTSWGGQKSGKSRLFKNAKTRQNIKPPPLKNKPILCCVGFQPAVVYVPLIF